MKKVGIIFITIIFMCVNIITVTAASVSEYKRKVNQLLEEKNYEQVVSVCRDALGIEDLSDINAEFFSEKLRLAQTEARELRAGKARIEIRSLIREKKYYDAIELSKKHANDQTYLYQQRMDFVDLESEAKSLFKEFQDSEKREEYKKLIDLYKFEDAMNFCEDQYNNISTSPRDKEYFFEEQKNVTQKCNEFIRNNLQEVIEIQLSQGKYEESVDLCNALIKQNIVTKDNKKTVEQILSQISIKESSAKVERQEKQIKNLLKEKRFLEAKKQCEFLLNQSYVTEIEKMLLQELLFEIESSSWEYWKDTIKPNVENNMKNKMYIEAIGLCEQALEKIILTGINLDYVNTTKTEAQKKYNDYRTNNTIKQLIKYMSEKLYVEAIQLCDAELGKDYLTEKGIKETNQIRNEAQEKYNEYRRKTTVTKLEGYMSQKLYLEAMQLCAKEKGKEYLSADDAAKLEKINNEAQTKYNEYRARYAISAVKEFFDKGLYYETIAEYNKYIGVSYLSEVDKNTLETMKLKAESIIEERKIYLSQDDEGKYRLTFEQAENTIYKLKGIKAKLSSSDTETIVLEGDGRGFIIKRVYDSPVIDIYGVMFETYIIYNATKEVNQIRNYISRGLYLEAIALCDTLYEKNLSHEDEDGVMLLRLEAQDKYQQYLKNKDRVTSVSQARQKFLDHCKRVNITVVQINRIYEYSAPIWEKEIVGYNEVYAIEAYIKYSFDPYRTYKETIFVSKDNGYIYTC